MQDNPDPIPTTYSPELQELVLKLMTKNPAERPSTAEILKTSYVRDRMQQFVENTEINNMLSKGAVFKKQRPTIRRTNTREVNEVEQQQQ